jgi:hypothetical protein
MVIKLLADVNVRGQVARLVKLMQSDYWRAFWDHLDVRILTFHDVGLSSADTDAKVWSCCQQNQLYLLTNNRNEDGSDSLEATIRASSTSTSLPVFTFGDAEKIVKNKEYAAQIVESLYDHLLRIDSLHGTGRLYLP